MAGEVKENWEGFEAQTDQARLDDDPGSGKPIIIRMFEFSANPGMFKLHKPTKQQLMNEHARSIEQQLFFDGLDVFPDVDPKITINKRKTKYRIIVAATPRKGHTLMEKPRTVQQILHNK